MNATALAQALDGSRGSDGTISLRRLQNLLAGSGFEELARAVESLSGRLTHARLRVEMADPPMAPWF